MECSLETLLKYEQPTKYIVASEEYSDEYPIPVLTAGKSFILGYTNEENGICRASISPVIIYDDFTTDSKYVDFDFKVKSSAMKILHQINKEDNLRYLFYVVSYLKYTPFSHKRTWISDFSKLRIKYRLPIEQNAIVSELDKIQAALDNKKEQLKKLDELIQSKFYEMFGDPVVNDKGWKMKNLGEISKVKIGPFGSLLHNHDYIKGGIPLVNPIHMSNEKICPDYNFSVSNEKIKELQNYILQTDDILLARRGDIGRCALVGKEENGFLCGTGSLFVRPIKSVNSIFIVKLIRCNSMIKYLTSFAKGVTMLNINCKIVEQLPIILPPLPLQQAFAAYVEKVEQAKAIVNQEIAHLQELLNSRMDYYFRK